MIFSRCWNIKVVELSRIIYMTINHILLFCYKYAIEHRCRVVVSRLGLCGNISRSNPLKDNHLLLKVKPLDNTKEEVYTTNFVNKLLDVICRILQLHLLYLEHQKHGKAIANVTLLQNYGIRIDVNLTAFSI